MTRQSTSKEILDVDWHYPVASTFGDKGTGHTVVAKASYAWPTEEAFAKIADGDDRPLLVFRECHACAGSEHALFSRRLNNEKTKLLLHWFRCVKLPAEVSKKNHPFHKVFDYKYGFRPHLFICTKDGANKIVFTGKQSQSRLQYYLTKTIKIAYKKKPKLAIKAMMKCMTKFDMLDLREQELLTMVDVAREEKGPKSSAVKKLNKTLAKVRKDKAKVWKTAKAVCDLKLKVVKAPAIKASASKATAIEKAGTKKGD
jgi:hypothetical protein